MFGNGGNWAYGPDAGSLRVRMPWNDSCLEGFDKYRFPYGVTDSLAFMDYLQRFDVFRVTQLDEDHIAMDSLTREPEIFAVGKNAELVRIVGVWKHDPSKVITVVGRIINDKLFPMLHVRSEYDPGKVYEILFAIDIRRGCK